MKLESQGYKVGTLPGDFYKPNEIGLVRSLSTDGKKLILSLVFKVIKQGLPVLPVEIVDEAENHLLNYLNEGYMYKGLIPKKVYLCKKIAICQLPYLLYYKIFSGSPPQDPSGLPTQKDHVIHNQAGLMSQKSTFFRQNSIYKHL